MLRPMLMVLAAICLLASWTPAEAQLTTNELNKLSLEALTATPPRAYHPPADRAPYRGARFPVAHSRYRQAYRTTRYAGRSVHRGYAGRPAHGRVYASAAPRLRAGRSRGVTARVPAHSATRFPTHSVARFPARSVARFPARSASRVPARSASRAPSPAVRHAAPSHPARPHR